MAKVKLNPLLEEVQGSVGDVVFKRYGNRTIMSKKADMSNVKPSPKQLAHQARFAKAAAFGRKVLADPELKALYGAVASKQGKPVQAIAIGDAMNAPVVHEVDLSGYTGAPGDPIGVHATDDFGVETVSVTLMMEDGTVIEEGVAEASGKDRWTYTCTASVEAGTSVRAVATAEDRAGGRGQLSVVSSQ